MNRNRPGVLTFSGAALCPAALCPAALCLTALCLTACAGGAKIEQHDVTSRADDTSGTSEVISEAASDPYAPRPLTPEVLERIWANMFGGFTRASQLEVSAEERDAIIASLEALGIAPSDVSFVGANVFVEDVSFSAEPLLSSLRSQPVDKGKVLAQVIPQVIGTHDTTLVSPSDVLGAPVQYASRSIDGTFLFNRPEVDAAFAHALVLADDVPEAIFTAFRNSIAEIGNASENDCLSPTFLQVFSRSEFDATFPKGPFDVPPRVLEAVYAPSICGPTALGCTQHPRAENVVLSPSSPDGQIGTFQHRLLFGGFMGINSSQITPDSAEFSTITHELLHAMGIAHPVVERFRGAVAAKLVVPGTEPGDGGFDSIMAFRNTANRVLNLSPDDIDTIETLYGAASGCSYSPQPIPIEANVIPVDPIPVDAGSNPVDPIPVDAGSNPVDAEAN